MEALLFEPMTVGQIFRTTFALYRRHFWHFVAICAVIEVPLVALSAGRSAVSVSESTARQTSEQVQVRDDGADGSVSGDVKTAKRDIRWGALGVELLLVSFQIAIGALAGGAMMMSVSALYAGDEVTVGQAYRMIRPKAVTLGCAGVLVLLVWGLGTCMCIFPGFIILYRYAVVPGCILAEDLGVIAAMRRSHALVRSRIGRTLGVVLPVFLVGCVIGTFISNALPYGADALFGDGNPWIRFISSFVSSLCLMFLTPICMISAILLYYNLRVFNEGVTFARLADEVILKRQFASPDQLA